MANKQTSNVDSWLKKEIKHNREALESASRYFDKNDNLTVNTLEAIYGQENSFGLSSKLGKRGSSGAAGHFRLEKATAERYGLIVSKQNDQRFDIDYASSAADRYLKDIKRKYAIMLIMLLYMKKNFQKNRLPIKISNRKSQEKNIVVQKATGSPLMITQFLYAVKKTRNNYRRHFAFNLRYVIPNKTPIKSRRR